MTADEHKQRLRKLLRQTLDEQLAAAAGAASSNGNLPHLSGPWATFFDERNAWDTTRPLDRDLYSDLRGHFDANVIREILFAQADVKISRTSLAEQQIDRLRDAAKRRGFEVVTSEGQWVPCADQGKGGWANRARPVVGETEPSAVRNVYIASDATLAETGKLLDEAGEDDLFGALLGIPACCREAFDRQKVLAADRQCDFVPCVLENTGGVMPYDWRLNYLAQYFGLSLLSFFPCSFRCPAAAEVADRTFAMLARCDAAWAAGFVALQKTNVLYTEYDGLHLFRAQLCDGQIVYQSRDLRSSEATKLADLLRQGDRLEVRGKHDLQIYRGSTKIGDLARDDVCMCAFN